MHIEIERELHNLTLSAIIHGRRLAEEWLATGCVPKGSAKRRILETLDKLRDREGFDGLDDEFIVMMGDALRCSMNEYREGAGDRALAQDVDTTWEQDRKVIEHVNLVWRWKKFREAKHALDDKLAAAREADLMLASIV